MKRIVPYLSFDGDCRETRGDGVELNLECESGEEVDGVYAALVEGGQDTMAPHDAFWGARFAMLADRFGVRWMLNHERTNGA